MSGVEWILGSVVMVGEDGGGLSRLCVFCVGIGG